jgi:hypothetical protein
MSALVSTYSRDELPQILRSLKQYKKMLREMGSRASVAFFIPKDKNFRVEYDPTMDKDMVIAYTIAAFDTYFSQKLTALDIRFHENPALISGARIFAGDDMVDISFKNIENTLKQL